MIVMERVREIVECCVCRDGDKPQTVIRYTCPNGHSTCGACWPRVESMECPLCRETGLHRNAALSRIVCGLGTTCDDCGQDLMGHEIDRHRSVTCPKRAFPYTDVPIDQYFEQHAIDTDQIVLDTTECSDGPVIRCFRLKMDDAQHQLVLLLRHFRIFFELYVYSVQDVEMEVRVQTGQERDNRTDTVDLHPFPTTGPVDNQSRIWLSTSEMCRYMDQDKNLPVRLELFAKSSRKRPREHSMDMLEVSDV